MYPFWDPIISPILKVCGGRRIVEIGALRGETTAKMLDDLGPDSEVHVIDPVPAFDPVEHAAQFPGRYVFHRDLSLNVLGELDAFDVALIDGDHNWYSVYNEMRLLAESARRSNKPMPLCILHDVTWPYGRRDLYYDPSNIPVEFQQPFDHRGMHPDRKQLLKQGGMNHTLANALVEGGERNGVRTGMDDFIAGYDRPLREVVIPIYFGLAIVAEQAMLDERPELAALLDHIESPQGVRELLELSEYIRLEGVVFQQNVERMRFGRIARAVERHLSVLRDVLDATPAELDAADDAVRFVVEHPEVVGDVAYTGSADGLRYLAAALEAHEVENRSVWAVGESLRATADAIGDRVTVVDIADSGSIEEHPDTPIAATCFADDAAAARVRAALGDLLGAETIVRDADRHSVR